MKILVIGGTNFIGRVLVEQLLEKSTMPGNNWELCLFNRGKTNPDLFPTIRRIIGDRQTDDIYQLCEENWDVAIDLSCYYPFPFEDWLIQFKKKVKRYIFISTVSVYDSQKTVGKAITENSPLLFCSEEQKINGKPQVAYGELKVACENSLLAHKDLDSIIFRPSVVYGKYDFTDRFYYWLYRLKTAQQLLVPDVPFVDSYTFVEDLAQSIVHALDMPLNNIPPTQRIYNSNTHTQMSLVTLLEQMATALQINANIQKASPSFLEKANIKPWKDICLWLPADIAQYDNTRLKNDLLIQWDSFATSVKKTADYFDSIGWPIPKTGISLAQEKALLAQLKQA